MLAVVCLTRTSMGVQFQAIASVAPLLVADLALSYAEVGSLIGLYMLPGALFALVGGVLGQRFGERRVVIAGLGLMAAGAVVTAASHSFTVAATGRLVSGIGAVLMNILLAKMVADWFADREMSTAMAVMLTSWPVGLGIAAATFGTVGAAWGWRGAVYLTAVGAVVGLLLMVGLYRDPPARSTPQSPGRRPRLSRRHLALAVTSGVAWGCFNASLVAMIAFAPGVLIARGASLGEAGATVSTAIWVTLISVPAGGILADRLRRPNLLIVGGSIAAGIAMMLVPTSTRPLAMLLLAGVLAGAPPGALMSLLPKALPTEVLTVGFGVNYAVFYAVMAVTQPIAGALRDATGGPAAPVVFTGMLMIATAVALAIFRGLERRR